MNDFVERLRAKPEHVRKSLALLGAGGFTAVIALFWAVSFTSSASFALSTSNESKPSVETAFKEDSASLLSAVGTLLKGDVGQITVVETRASSTVDAPKGDTRTVIPF